MSAAWLVAKTGLYDEAQTKKAPKGLAHYASIVALGGVRSLETLRHRNTERKLPIVKSSRRHILLNILRPQERGRGAVLLH